MQFNINKGNGVSTCLVGRNRFLLGKRAQYEIIQSNKIKSKSAPVGFDRGQESMRKLGVVFEEQRCLRFKGTEDATGRTLLCA